MSDGNAAIEEYFELAEELSRESLRNDIRLLSETIADCASENGIGGEGGLIVGADIEGEAACDVGANADAYACDRMGTSGAASGAYVAAVSDGADAPVAADCADSANSANAVSGSEDADSVEPSDGDAAQDAASEGSDRVSCRRFQKSLLALIAAVLVAALCAVAIAQSRLTVADSTFETGSIGVSVNGGAPIVETDGFEPGHSLERDFYVESTGSASGYVRLYFANVQGDLAPVLQMTLRERDAGDVLYEGAPAGFTFAQAADLGEPFAPGERRWYTAYFEMPTGTGNAAQGRDLSFDVRADITQARNNDAKQFE